MERKKITFDLFIRGVIFLVLATGFLMLLYRLSNVLVPFFLAWLIAYLMFPMVKFFQYKLRMRNRVLAITSSLLLLTILFTIAAYTLIPPILSEFARAKDLAVEYISSNNTANHVPTVIHQFIQENIGTNQLIKLLDKQEFQQVVRDTVPHLWNIFTESVSIVFSLLSLLMVIIYTIFILLDYETISEGWPGLVPSRYRSICVQVMLDINEGMNKYFRGQAMVAFLVGILFSIGFLIVGLPLAIPLGLFIGLLNMVPYLQMVGFIPTIILCILKSVDSGQSFWIVLFASLMVFAVVQLIQDLYLTPKIMGKVTGLNPAIILLSLSVWGSLMGVLGMIIALPMTTLLLSYYQKYVIRYEQHELQNSDTLSDSK